MTVRNSSALVEPLEVVDTGRRRRWSEDEKLRIVAESLSGPRQVSSTARRHGISRSLLTHWRRQFQIEPVVDADGAAAGAAFVPAVVVPEPAAGAQPVSSSSTRMEIVVSAGLRIIVDAGVDATALARVLDVLERRRPAGAAR